MKTIVLLSISNIFMTVAWYGHLKYKSAPLISVVLVSWLIAFFEYCFQVPANRIGHASFSAAQLKTIQEVISLTIFGIFSVLYLKEAFTLKCAAGFSFIALGAYLIFQR
ncbi:MAG: DMT family protein [Deltaproteobacteria bacterium]|nr:DMT family protein [Deltaproteobacteria bacterium]